MKQISSVDLYFLVKEFKILENERIDNFYYEDGVFYIKVYTRGKGHLFLTNKVSKFIYLGTDKPESSHPSSFMQHLRKYLRNGFIREISLVDSERILKINIEKKEGEELKNYFLVLELFANGNVILTDDNLKILNSLQKKKFKDRKVMVREQYELPPAKELTIINLDSEKFKKVLAESDLNIVKFLAIKFGLGGKYSEEVCLLADIDKNKLTSELKSNEINSIENILYELKVRELYPKIILNEKQEVVDFIPFDFKSIDKEKKSVETFNDAVKSYFEQFLEEKDERAEEFAKELKKLQNRLDKQLQQKQQVEKDYKKFNSYGNKIYENYAVVEELLNSINSAAKEKGWDYVLETIKSNEKLSKIIKKVNYKNNEIILDI